MKWTIVVATAGIGVLVILLGWRGLDRWMDARAWDALLDLAPPVEETFSPEMVESLPEPARRYFLYTFQPGAPLCNAIEIETDGEIGMGSKAAPEYRPMTARQILAPPNGLVWKLESGLISGSDAVTPTAVWTRFWLAGLIPVVRAGGTQDYYRSAFGRVVSEAAFWSPASLLPSKTVHWEAMDADTARAVVSFNDIEQAVDITVNEEGQPTQVLIQRWSNENPEREFRAQPFGGTLSLFREIDGMRIPTRVEGGNHFGTEDYFPFYRVDVSDARCAAAGASGHNRPDRP